MKKLWMGEVIGSPALGRKAGALILIHKSLPWSVQSMLSDGLGRKVLISLKFPSQTIQITNVYAPNSPGSTFFKDTPALIMKNPLPFHVVGGDFNTNAPR